MQKKFHIFFCSDEIILSRNCYSLRQMTINNQRLLRRINVNKSRKITKKKKSDSGCYFFSYQNTKPAKKKQKLLKKNKKSVPQPIIMTAKWRIIDLRKPEYQAQADASQNTTIANQRFIITIYKKKAQKTKRSFGLHFIPLSRFVDEPPNQ